MLILFLSDRGIIHYEFFRRKRIGKSKYSTYNSVQFVKSLRRFRKKVNARRRKTHCSNVILHFDNCRVHTPKRVRSYLEKHRIKILPHPPYSPDISPCDFYLFGPLKSYLEGYSTNNYRDLKIQVKKYLKNIEKETLKKVMDAWKRRLRYVIRNNGNYYNK